MTRVDRIYTTHVGSLPRPPELLTMMQAKAAAERYDDAALEKELSAAVIDIVKRQVDVGIDIVSDGEMSKPDYATYVTERLTGFGGKFRGHAARDLLDYKEFARHLVDIGGTVPAAGGACCQGPVGIETTALLERDIDNLKAAVKEAPPVGTFINAASPGVVTVFQKNEFYPSEQNYIDAVADALRCEYEAIVDAGFLLQIDSPDLAMGRHLAFAELSDSEFIRIVRRNIEALNQAVANIPAENMRMHLCWGNYPGPHHRDIPLASIIEGVFEAKPKFLLLEGANPRHSHEWEVFRTIKLPDEKVLVPGVVDSTSNFIEHPDAVTQRICHYADVVGKERVIAGTDCGFSTFSGYPNVHPDIAWAKLASLVQGAEKANSQLWSGQV